MKFMRHFHNLEGVEQFKTRHQKHHANDEDELERYGFFKKSKARVAKHDDQSKHEDVKERIWINRVTGEITLQPLERGTDTPSCMTSVSGQFEKVTQLLNQLLAKAESATREEHSH